ncbi:MAG: hypothetical protein LBB27_03870 [Tannerellaceae bacterium]|nr:hypothetical protein [Tannerellaceae bacterium]
MLRCQPVCRKGKTIFKLRDTQSHISSVISVLNFKCTANSHYRYGYSYLLYYPESKQIPNTANYVATSNSIGSDRLTTVIPFYGRWIMLPLWVITEDR